MILLDDAERLTVATNGRRGDADRDQLDDRHLGQVRDKQGEAPGRAMHRRRVPRDDSGRCTTGEHIRSARARKRGLTSMTNLVVVPRPVPEQPMDKVIVRYEWGFVQSEHVAHTGRNDKISEACGRDGAAVLAFHD